MDVNSVNFDIAILPAYPAMFKIASPRDIENNTVLLHIEPSNIPK